MGAKGISKQAPIGKTFDRLTVISAAHQRSGGSISVTCRCTCGDEREYFPANLQKQKTSMCPSCRLLVHPARGQSSTHPLFVTWKGIIQRYDNPKHTFYRLYGALGVRMCKRWRDNFLAFAADVGERPGGMTLDRIRGDGDYEPGNVRWATHTTQMNNRCMNVRIEWRGQSLTLAQAAREAGIDVATLGWRVKAGWDTERIMTTPSTMTANRGIPKPRRVTHV